MAQREKEKKEENLRALAQKAREERAGIRRADGRLNLFVCLFVLRLNIPVNNFSVMSGRSQLLLGLTSTVGSSCVLLKDTIR